MEATDINIQQMPILIGQKGEITIPQVIQDYLNVNEGDLLTLVQIGNLILLTPQQPEVQELIDQITTLMETENVDLNNLLAGLEAEREALYQGQ